MNAFWCLAAAVAALSFFQFHIPIGSAVVNLNLADPFAALSLPALFLLWRRDGLKWRVPHVLMVVGIWTAVVTVGLAIGYARFGFTSWAFVNKFAGWLVLLAFGAAGAIAGKLSFDRSVNVFVYAFSVVGVVAIGQQCLVNLGIIPPMPMNGFAGNSNAFAFQCMMALCVILGSSNPRLLWLAIIPVACCILSGSRAAAGAAIILIAFAYVYIRGANLKAIGAVVGGVALMAAIYLLARASAYTGRSTEDLYAFQLGLPFSANYTLSNSEHLQTMQEGLRMFLAHPIFGAGLGDYNARWQGAETANVIHSTPVWILAEFGSIGAVAFAVPIIYLFCRELRLFRRNDAGGNVLILVVTVFSVMSLVHELLYQRTLWFLLGMCLAIPRHGVEANSPDTKPPR